MEYPPQAGKYLLFVAGYFLDQLPGRVESIQRRSMPPLQKMPDARKNRLASFVDIAGQLFRLLPVPSQYV